jgi:hypothetical protein
MMAKETLRHTEGAVPVCPVPGPSAPGPLEEMTALGPGVAADLCSAATLALRTLWEPE